MTRSIGSLSGLERLKERLGISGAEADLREQMREQAVRIGEDARATVQHEHPGGTGALARSIEIMEEGEEDDPHFQIGTQSAVGRYLEFGTVRMRAQPWLVPALHRHLPKVKQGVRKVVTRALRLDSQMYR